VNQSIRRMQVVGDAAALAEAAAERLIARLAPTGDRPAVCLSGGGTPERLYRLLATERYRARLPWQHVHWFWGDDRFVPPDEFASYRRFAEAKGFLLVAAAPLTRSSYHAGDDFRRLREARAARLADTPV